MSVSHEDGRWVDTDVRPRGGWKDDADDVYPEVDSIAPTRLSPTLTTSRLYPASRKAYMSLTRG